MGTLGPAHWLLVFVVFLLLFGGNKVSELGKGLGEGIRNFKKGLRGDEDPADGARAASDDVPRSPLQIAAPRRTKSIDVEVE